MKNLAWLLLVWAAGAWVQQGAVAAQTGESCTVPTGTFEGQLKIVDPGRKFDNVGITLKIISVAPAEVEFTIASTQFCAGVFRNKRGVCRGNLLRVRLDRSSAATEDCRTPIGLHIRFEDGKLVGRYGKAIKSGTDNVSF
jgi:hypothetical protein